MPCLTLHPANPLLDQFGQSISFDLSRFNQFEELLSQWGITDCNNVKKSLAQAILSGMNPSEYPKPTSRETRATLRITLRQMRQLDEYKPHISCWCQYFENLSVA